MSLGFDSKISWNLATCARRSSVAGFTSASRVARRGEKARNEGGENGFSPRKGFESRCESQEGVSKRVLVPRRARREIPLSQYRAFPFLLSKRPWRTGVRATAEIAALSPGATDIFSGEYRAIDCPSFPFILPFNPPENPTRHSNGRRS